MKMKIKIETQRGKNKTERLGYSVQHSTTRQNLKNKRKEDATANPAAKWKTKDEEVRMMEFALYEMCAFV